AYFLESRNFSVSVGPSAAPSSVPESASRKVASRSRAPMAMWCEHFGQTLRLRSSSGRYSTATQRGHFSHRPSGTLRLLPPALRMRYGISFCSQLMAATLFLESRSVSDDRPAISPAALSARSGGVKCRPDRRQEITGRVRSAISASPVQRLDQRAADHYAVR